ALVVTTADIDLENNADQDFAVVNGLPDLTLDKRHSGSFTVGQPATYTFVVRNLGTAATNAAITVTDTLPAGLTYLSGSGAGVTFTASGGVVTARYTGSLAATPDDSLMFTLTVGVDAAALPSVTNAAVVATAGDSDPPNGPDRDAVTGPGLPDRAPETPT